MSDDLFDIPWDPWPHGWRLGTSDNWAAFDAAGLHLLGESGVAQDLPWSDLLGVTIGIGRHSTPRDVWEFATPKPTPNLPFAGTIEMHVRLSRRDLDVAVPMTGRCSWQVAFVLEDLLTTLGGERLQLVGQPGLVDSVVRAVAGRVRPWSRLLIDVDAFGLDRFIAGHGAYRRVIEMAVGRYA